MSGSGKDCPLESKPQNVQPFLFGRRIKSEEASGRERDCFSVSLTHKSSSLLHQTYLEHVVTPRFPLRPNLDLWCHQMRHVGPKRARRLGMRPPRHIESDPRRRSEASHEQISEPFVVFLMWRPYKGLLFWVQSARPSVWETSRRFVMAFRSILPFLLSVSSS